jgi:hypothetical protein
MSNPRQTARWLTGLALVGATITLASGWGSVARAFQSPSDPPPSDPFGVPSQSGDRPFTDDEIEFFESKVRPVLAERCFDCHGPEADPPEAGLRLDSRSAVLTGGHTGPAVVPGDPSSSLLISAVRRDGLFQMPPDSELPPEEVAVLVRWVEMGAPWPPETEQSAAAATETFDLAARRDSHWCWHPVVRPDIPSVSDPSWPKDDLDKFILAGLDANGIAPAAPADRRTLIRRLYFDLIGLPPTPEQIEAFMADPAPDAWEKVVDELLASPRFGEHWARHWMDLVRFAETCGHEYDYPLPYAYQYRDYLIRAFNADVPYDQLVIEHIAGDLLDEPRRHPIEEFNESILGTGFWFLGEATHGPVDVRGDEAGRIDNQIDVMTKTFLGLTVACARCHDHKFDAISTRDYYALAGYLQSSRRQDVMLDPGRRIERAASQARAIVTEGDLLARELLNRARDLDADRMARGLAAAIDQLIADPAWRRELSGRIEGESLSPNRRDGGDVQVQDLSHADLSWSGGQQLWWMDGKPGDRLEFEIPVAASGRYTLVADWTTAPDYGVVRVAIGDQWSDVPLDLYTNELGKTGERELLTAELGSGTTRLVLELAEPNPAAAPRNMVGLDWIGLRPVETPDHVPAPADTARRRGLDEAELARWAAALRDPGTLDQRHPAWLARQAAMLDEPPTAQHLEDLCREIRESAARSGDPEPASASVVFADFDEPWQDWGDWFVTGEAFGPNPVRAGQWNSTQDEPALLTVNAAHSGRNGDSFCGVLRSPTFEITHPYIHYRIAGNQCSVRVIIDGYTLDTYNPLLFNGVTIQVATDGRFQWLTQGNDLGNYIGHRAHLEFIDHGAGFVAIDKIVFSDSPTIETQPAAASVEVASAQSPQTVDELAAQLARLWKDTIASDSSDQAPLVDWLARHQLIDVPDEIAHEFDVLITRRRNLAADVPAPTFAIGMTDGTAEDEHVFIRGNHNNLGALAPRQLLTALVDGQPAQAAPSRGSGRLELAREIASPDNALTARVMVNRVWHHLLGQGLVPSVDNFGVMGEAPTNRQLLDYLADEWTHDGWSIKRLVRRIVLSQTYAMSTTANPESLAADPTNRLNHCARLDRLSGEQLRDAILATSGELDTTMFGTSVPIYLTEFLQGRGRPDRSGPLDGNGRRSVYLEIRRNFLPPMMLAFDMPIPFNSIGRRNQSNVPAQSLILMNDPFVVEQAERFAERLINEQTDIEQRINRMFELAIGRPATPQDLGRAQDFLRTQAAAMGLTSDRVESDVGLWRDLCHVMFNLKEFIFVD